MNTKLSRGKVFVNIFSFLVLAIVIIMIFYASNYFRRETLLVSTQTNSPTQAVGTPENLLPSPVHYVGFPSPTVNIDLLPTSPPRKIAQTIDTAPELPPSEKGMVWVLQTDGYYRVYLLGPHGNINDYVKLQPGEKITEATTPLSANAVNPVPPTPYPSRMPGTPTTNPYPGPSSPTPIPTNTLIPPL